MNVSSQATIVSEIVSGVIGILINGDRVAIPIPIHYIWPVDRRNLKIGIVEPESLTVATLNMEYVLRSEAESELTVRKWVVNVGNLFMLNPLFPFDVRPGSGGQGSAAVLSFTASLRLPTASLWPSRLWRAAAGFRPRFCRAARRTMLRKMLAGLITLASTSLPAFRFPASLLRIQVLSCVHKQTHRRKNDETHK